VAYAQRVRSQDRPTLVEKLQRHVDFLGAISELERKVASGFEKCGTTNDGATPDEFCNGDDDAGAHRNRFVIVHNSSRRNDAGMRILFEEQSNVGKEIEIDWARIVVEARSIRIACYGKQDVSRASRPQSLLCLDPADIRKLGLEK